MLTRAQLLTTLDSLPLTAVDASPDFDNSVSSSVIRCIFENQRAVAVASDTKTQIGALVDLVDLHLHGGGTYDGRQVSADEVTLLFVEDPDRPEAKDALCSLAANLRRGPRVRLIEVGTAGVLRPVEPRATTFEDASLYLYKRFLSLMLNVEEPPDLLRDLVAGVNVGAYRAYPMLSSRGSWSLRLEGLEVGRFRGNQGTPDVGKPGKMGVISHQRKTWQASAGDRPVPVTSTSAASSDSAAEILRSFAKRWLPTVEAGGDAEPSQDEHALESRILRGRVPITTADGTQLTLLHPPPHVDARSGDDLVNWGSQFPTRWGRTKAPGARYLDALLRDGSTPWALEIKVDGGGGVGQYYRHAVAQAVLYRQFIRTAEPLKPWFDRYDLDQRTCRAAVVIPDLLPAQAKWDSRLEAVCRAFDVDLIRIPRHFAGLRDTEAA
jgi:hypothetical protein